MATPTRRASYALTAALLAAGAPMGLCVLRSVRAGTLSLRWMSGEISADPVTYAYLFVSTAVVFSAFGFALGRQADRLAELSSTDGLTGLWNRRHFQERLEEEFARSIRYGAPLSLLLIDLDGLKETNDRLGHRAGDAALRRAAAAIRKGARGSDLAARWGGDEFVLLAPNAGGEEAGLLAERVRALAAEESPSRGTPAVTVSVGVSTTGPGRRLDAPEALVREADAALYDAKRGGRNRVVSGPGDGGMGARKGR